MKCINSTYHVTLGIQASVFAKRRTNVNVQAKYENSADAFFYRDFAYSV